MHQGDGVSSCVTSCGGLRSGQGVLRRAEGLHTFALNHVEEDVVKIE